MLKKNKTFESITAGLTTMVNDLQKLSQARTAESAEIDSNINKLVVQREVAIADAERAATAASKISTLLA